MDVANFLIRTLHARRLRAIDRFSRHPFDVQREQFQLLLKYGAGTEYLTRFGMGSFDTPERFVAQVPVVDYNALQPDIERMRRGEQNILWPSPVRWFARSSGTTGDRSKYLPVTPESLRGCHFQGGKDVIAVFARNFPDSKAFRGKTLTLGGSHQLDAIEGSGPGVRCGDLSAILIQNTPPLYDLVREPAREIALIPDFSQKVEAICRTAIHKPITSFAGVPSWNLVLMQQVLEHTGKQNLLEVWPNLSLFIHGGVNFGPYRELYRQIIPSDQMRYMETYNASEGFFALQDDPASDDMLLMLDGGVYYEFLPLKSLDDPTQAVPLEGVRCGINYAMIITTSGGLWRYMIGDTVQFTNLNPYKIRITGRTKSFINAFGEELIVDHADRALAAACSATASRLRDYTAAPLYMTKGRKGAHQWFVEFETPPADLTRFIEVLDQTLQELNSDYAAKRLNSTTLTLPQVVVAPRGTFYRWLETRKKVGGQHKVPRLVNDRSLIDELLTFI